MKTAETSNRIDLVVDLRPQLCCMAVVLCSGSAQFPATDTEGVRSVGNRHKLQG